jgi:taurine dioxygenase
VSWKEVPPKYSMLLGRQVPSLGGDTLFANQYQAYRDLSAPIKTLMDSLDAIHDGRQFDPDLIRHPVTHPVVIRHPETGRQALYVNRNFTQRIKDLQATESRSLLEFLFAHCSRATYHTRVRYEAGTLAIWDNRCMQHSPCHDYDNSETRSMERVTVLCEERPKR